jgi:hypothetical protein
MQSRNEPEEPGPQAVDPHTPDFLRAEPPAGDPGSAPGYGQEPAPGVRRPDGEEVPAPNQSPYADTTYQPPSVPPQEAG